MILFQKKFFQPEQNPETVVVTNDEEAVVTQQETD